MTTLLTSMISCIKLNWEEHDKASCDILPWIRYIHTHRKCQSMCVFTMEIDEE